jgi:hypothetical protein
MQQGKQMRFTDGELDLIKQTFKGNDKLLKLLRKVFLPEYDPNAPIGQVIDLWMTVPVKEMTAQDALVNILARNSLISHVEMQIQQLNVLAEADQKTAEEIQEKIKKDSAK